MLSDHFQSFVCFPEHKLGRQLRIAAAELFGVWSPFRKYRNTRRSVQRRGIAESNSAAEKERQLS